MPAIQFGRVIITALVATIAGVGGLALVNTFDSAPASITLTPQTGAYVVGETFTVTVEVQSDLASNVFSGEIYYEPDILHVANIDYNTSIADLWAVKPWYDAGDGTITFAGGTLATGGFVGNGTLMTITFKAIAAGEGILELTNARILAHDGLGSDIDLPPNPIDALFTVDSASLQQQTLTTTNNARGVIRTAASIPSTDLNKDGVTTLIDVSSFFILLSRQDLQADFTLDGVVNTADMSVLLNAL